MACASFALPLKGLRKRSFFIPREHGAWGMLLVPLVTGAAVGGPQGPRIIWILLFAATALALFCLRTPVEAGLEISPLRPQDEAERRLIHFSIYLYASVAGMSLAVLLWWAHAYGLLLLGVVAALALVFQAVLKQLGRNTRMNAQLTGAVALSSTAAGAYYLAAGRFNATAAVLWLANWLFAADQIHFVQIRIHSARAMTFREKMLSGKPFLLHQGACLMLVGLMWRSGWIPGLMLVAFGLLFLRGIGWLVESPRPLRIRRLGAIELLYAIAFGVIIIAGYQPQIG